MSVTNTMLEAFMQLSTARQQVIAENVAHANTPGVLGKDIPIPSNFNELVKVGTNNTQLHVATTSSMHIPGSKPRIKFKTVIDSEGELKPNGNNIDLPTQAKKAAENKIKLDTALKAYAESMKTIKIVLGKEK